jgi:rhodanese-related sulfurtransferase
VERIDVAELHARADAVQILDVRERSEWDEGHIPGPVFAPYHDLADLPTGIDASAPVAVICTSGQRSALAASVLRRRGVKTVIHVADGGVGTWQRQGGPIESSDAGR